MIRQAMSQVRENMTGMKWDTEGLWRPPSSLVRMYTCEREHGGAGPGWKHRPSTAPAHHHLEPSPVPPPSGEAGWNLAWP